MQWLVSHAIIDSYHGLELFDFHVVGVLVGIPKAFPFGLDVFAFVFVSFFAVDLYKALPKSLDVSVKFLWCHTTIFAYL